MDIYKLFDRNRIYLKQCSYIDQFIDLEVRNVKIVYLQNRKVIIQINDWEDVIVDQEKTYDFDTILNTNVLINPIQSNVLYMLHELLRQTDKCGFDNRMNLYYDDYHMFYASMFLVDWKEILKDNQFYICFTENGQNKLCINNNTIGFREINRIVIFYQPQSCGYEFFKEIIKKNKYVLYEDGWQIHRYLENVEIKIGIKNFVSDIFKSKNKISAVDFITNIKKIEKLSEVLGEKIFCIINKFEELFGEEMEMSISDVFKGILIADYYIQHEENTNPRILPLLIYFPDHYLKYMEMYDAILNDFKDVIFFRLVRNPVIRTIRAYEFIKRTNSHYIAKFIDVLTEELGYDDYSFVHGGSFCVRFEDLKRNPRKVMAAVCKCFKIPCEDDMFRDPTLFREDALSPKLDKIFTEEDIKRLKILYKPILQYYQYYDEEISDDIRTLLDYTFGFEKELANFLKIDFIMLHWAIQTKIKEIHMKNRNKMKFPKLLL